MINLELTPKIKEWLDSEPSKRNLAAGATLLLQVTRNKILYANIMRNLHKNAEAIEYHLNKIYNQRLVIITHEEVSALMTEVNGIAKARGLDNPEPAKRSVIGSAAVPRTEFQRGKRADHDELPPEVQQLYVENAEVLRRMRDAHTKLRLITPENSTCPDSDRYPWAKYIVEQDRLYRSNWDKYDHYIKGTPVAAIAPTVDARTESANAAKVCNLLLGQYAKSPKEELADRIRELYAKIVNPSDKLRNKMRDAGLL
ncbi:MULTISPECIES: hypothetical protein [Muribaculaceae]|uniref:hypothetical protein n=1 Tax=Muribaculaceae TaxID=2005473 RepID=UPI0025B64296|nr:MULTISPECIES: hypothetical protein [Muribaculaceae]